MLRKPETQTGVLVSVYPIEVGETLFRTIT